MSALAKSNKPSMTIDEFAEWTNSQDPDERWELVDGLPFKMMAPQTFRHGNVKGLVWNALRASVAAAGLPCQVALDGVGVRIDDHNGRIPDVSLQCEPLADDAIWLTAPMILVEVVSPGSGTRDSRDKLSDYFSLPSVQHYLLIYVDKRLVVHHKRGASDRDILTKIVDAGSIELSPPGFTVSVASFFDDAMDATSGV